MKNRLACCVFTLALFLGGCAAGQAPAASAPPALSPAPASSGGESAWQAPTGQELSALEQAVMGALSGGGGRTLFYSSAFGGVLPPSEWSVLDQLQVPPFFPEPGAELVGWAQYLSEHPGSQVAWCTEEFLYTPETAILGPQNSDGSYRIYSLAEKTAAGYEILSVHPVYLSAASMPPDPARQELELTPAQWAMVQHQARSLAASGIVQGFSGLSDLSPSQVSNYLWARAGDWGGADALEGYPANSLAAIVLQADFSAENGTWVSADALPEWARAEGAQLAAAPCEQWEALTAALENGSLTLEYARQGEELLVTARIPSGGAAVVLRYTFGLVPEGSGPTARTWCKGAELLEG